MSDFAGSGETLLRFDADEDRYKGKLIKLAAAIDRLREDKLVSDDAEVTLILYVATSAARKHLDETLAASPLPAWEVRIVQELPVWVRVDTQDAAFAELCERYYDEVFTDEHKGRAPLGYAGGALPVVLSHNTPNNSVCLLWADSTGEPGGLKRRALFPRYERHHRDRP